jgi:hypothetical protein
LRKLFVRLLNPRFGLAKNLRADDQEQKYNRRNGDPTREQRGGWVVVPAQDEKERGKTTQNDEENTLERVELGDGSNSPILPASKAAQAL